MCSTFSNTISFLLPIITVVALKEKLRMQKYTGSFKLKILLQEITTFSDFLYSVTCINGPSKCGLLIQVVFE